MTTTFMSAAGPGETLTQAVARRLRGQLAELRISQHELAEITGWGRMYVGRRISGETPMDTADLEQIEDLVGISARYLVTGEPPATLAPHVGGAASSKLLRRRTAKPRHHFSTDKTVDWPVRAALLPARIPVINVAA